MLLQCVANNNDQKGSVQNHTHNPKDDRDEAYF